jgi:hypothetical protein
MSNLKVPFAFDVKRNLVKAEDAEKGQKYFCPGCEALVILKKGEIKAAHYAHKESDICTQKQIIRQAAKYCMQKVVSEWKNNQIQSPVFVRECQICWERVDQNIPDKVELAEIDYKMGDKQLDVALMASGEVLAAIVIDIGQTLDKYEGLPLEVPHISVDGWKVIENPKIWQAELDAFRLLACERCKEKFMRFQERASRIANRTRVKIPTSYYRYGITHCWKCGEEIIVFAWPEDGHQTTAKPKKEPVPRTIQYRFSKTAGHKYWANTCPRCKMIQGSFYLHSEPGAPFFCVYCEEDTSRSYREDMYKIAFYAENDSH